MPEGKVVNVLEERQFWVWVWFGVWFFFFFLYLDII